MRHFLKVADNGVSNSIPVGYMLDVPDPNWTPHSEWLEVKWGERLKVSDHPDIVKAYEGTESRYFRREGDEFWFAR